jgi:hypothetical protein
MIILQLIAPKKYKPDDKDGEIVMAWFLTIR